MPSTHHCKICVDNGGSTNEFCNDHQIKCSVHDVITLYKKEYKEYKGRKGIKKNGKRCKFCDN